jgi:hypothetical protein
VLTLDSIVANITPDVCLSDTAGLTASLLEIGAPENDQYGTPSFQYTLLGTSATSTVTGTYISPVEQTITFTGEVLDPGNSYLIVLEASFPHDYDSFSWEYTNSPAYATPFGSIGPGIWQYTSNGPTSLVYDNVTNETPELTIYADSIPEPSSLVLFATGLMLLNYTRIRRGKRSVNSALTGHETDLDSDEQDSSPADGKMDRSNSDHRRSQTTAGPFSKQRFAARPTDGARAHGLGL